MSSPDEQNSDFHEELEIFQREIDRQRALEQMDTNTPTSTDSKPLWIRLTILAIFMIAVIALLVAFSAD